MRVSSGLYKGKALLVPKTGVIPTTDKLRQAVFNILMGRIQGARFCDLFAGTGAVGIEALSHGAAHAVFVESNERMYIMLKKNLETVTGDPALYHTVRHNAALMEEPLFGSSPPPFDIIFADPFYDDTRRLMEELHPRALRFLAPDGLYILEHASRDDFSAWDGFTNRRDYGDTALSFFERGGA